MELLLDLGLSLAIGLLVGTERGWQEREAPEGGRIAGIRTFGLIGFSGGLSMLLARTLGYPVLGFVFLALSAILIAAHLSDMPTRRDVGITTIVAALVTFLLGALAVEGERMIAAAGAVVTMTLLSMKPVLHRWLRGIQQPDLLAAIKLLLISVVVLPALPDRDMGPWDALNPRQIWLLVVLIASISFAGYIAIKLIGPRRGVLLTGLFGGMVSSTATTYHLARLARDHAAKNIASAGIVLASAVMFPRMLILVAVLNVQLVYGLLLPIGLMALVLASAALWLSRRHDRDIEGSEALLTNPLELKAAFSFGVFLAFVMLAAKALHEWLGAAGLYMAAVVSGIADVDAITLSLARVARGGVETIPIQQAIVLAAAVNSVIKGVITSVIAGRSVTVLPIMVLTAVAGAVGVYVSL